ncbi:Ubiquinone biosynthesis monooxygenase UbiB [Rhodovulum sp. PH10]|uniref:2-polyprenylphenol 6-hydroxylase n=1 Tax=Rhodovulum sp. PH10 TaxID=1187851 RepID=UPI00027C2259|nr:2-polyprenylphenol 6-hydroxylase [Rhodovulum sp. PH10]EJW09595.1 Ubiquinone biosynthesis monooxygenase UbiB [Rhodovulum sp. PH10]
MIPPLSHLIRLARAGFVLAREGVFALVDPTPLPGIAQLGIRLARLIERPRSDSSAIRLSAALSTLGPSYVKLGQFLATRPDVVGLAIAQDLESLQDKMPPFPQAEAEAAIEKALGRPVQALFASFGPPVAAASIAQVHRAEVATESGTKTVAVKVLRPGIESNLKADIRAFFFFARLAEKHSAEARRLRLTEVVATLARSVTVELDLRLEAAAASEMADNVKDDPDFRVPAVDWELTAHNVLTTEWVSGTPLSDRATLERRGLDLPKLGRTVIQSFLRHAVRDGFFHADMHPGNLFVDDEGRLVAVDFGIMGRLTEKERRFLAEILFGFITRDYRRVAEVHFEAGYVPPHHAVESFMQAIRAIGEPIHNRTAADISMAKLLTLLFEVTSLYDMRTRPELLLLQKTMVVVEGVGRMLDPSLDMWHTAEPVVRAWLERNLGPVGRVEGAVEGVGEVGRFIGAVPGLLARASRLTDQIDLATRDGILLAPDTVAGIAEAEARKNRGTTVALWVIAFLLLLHLLG